MENIIFDSLVQLGAVGVLVFVLVWLVMRYEKRMSEIHGNHKDEREEWRLQAREQHAEVVEVAKDSNTILAEIKTMIQLQGGISRANAESG